MFICSKLKTQRKSNQKFVFGFAFYFFLEKFSTGSFMEHVTQTFLFHENE